MLLSSIPQFIQVVLSADLSIPSQLVMFSNEFVV